MIAAFLYNIYDGDMNIDNIHFNYNINVDDLRKENISESEYKEYIMNYDKSSMNTKKYYALMEYDALLDVRPAISFYAAIMNILDDIDQDKLHKCVCKGIENENIYVSYFGIKLGIHNETHNGLTANINTLDISPYFVMYYIIKTFLYHLGMIECGDILQYLK